MENSDVKIKDLKQFGIILGIILAVLGSINYVKDDTGVWPWFFIFSAAIISAGILMPRKLRKIYAVFAKISYAIGWFNTRVVLIAVYYLLITPIGLFARCFRTDRLNRKIDKSVESYWEKCAVSVSAAGSLEKRF